jgi:aspartyl aminopeptidase
MLFDVEPYGGLMIATWADRDLALAGRVFITDSSVARGRRAILVNSSDPVCRITTLAIHLNRKVNDEGLKLNKHKHLSPLVGQLDHLVTEGETPSSVALKWIASLAGCDPDQIVGHDLCLYDTQPGSMIGLDRSYLQVARLDNLASSFQGLTALLEQSSNPTPDFTQVLSLFDHEEIGSQSARGAQSTFLGDVLTRLCGGPGEPLSRCVQLSYQVSADMAHAVHPHYADLHDGTHQPLLNHGPVIKNNVNMRYATDGDTAAAFRSACQAVGVTAQEFVNRPDLACGSTIGSITAGRLGLPTVDVGNPMWSMHSVREMAGVADQVLMHRVLSSFYSGA